MTTSDITLLSWLYILAAIVTSIFVALSLEKRRAIQMPAARPYRWGFYVGSMGLACAPLALLSVAVLIVAARNGRWEGVGYCLVLTIFFALHSICGWFIIRRARWAWIVGTILSCNLFVWIINFIYGRKRWQEFGSQSGSFTSPQTVPSRSLTKQQKVALVIAAAVVALFAYLSLSAEISRSGSEASAEDILTYTVIGTALRFTSPIGIIAITIVGFTFYKGRRMPSNTALEPTAAAPPVSDVQGNPKVSDESTPASSGGGSASDR